MKKQKAIKPTNEQIIFETIVYSTLAALQNHMLREGMITEANVKESNLTEMTVPMIQEVGPIVNQLVTPMIKKGLEQYYNPAGSDTVSASEYDLDSELTDDEIENVKTNYGLHPNTEKDQFGNFTSVEPSVKVPADGLGGHSGETGLAPGDADSIYDFLKKAGALGLDYGSKIPGGVGGILKSIKRAI